MMISISLKRNNWLLIVFTLFCCVAQAQEDERPVNTNSWFEEFLGARPENSNCKESLKRKDFKEFKAAIAAKVSEISMLRYAKIETEKNCLTTKQIKAIMELFPHEKHRLEYAVFAWPLSYNPDAYEVIYKGFQNSSSISKFNKAVRP